MTSFSRPAAILYAALFGAGVLLGGLQLAADVDRTSAGAGVATANWVHVGLGAVLVAALAAGWYRDRRALLDFLRRPLTGAGWAETVDALRWRRGIPLLRPPRFLAAVVMLYVPVRAGEQVLAGLDPDFTRDAWGGPSYAGAAAAHWLDGALLFLAGSVVVRVAAARRYRVAA